jgi:hypothetical protein
MRDKLKQLRAQLFGVIEEDRIDVEAGTGQPDASGSGRVIEPVVASVAGARRNGSR